MSSPPFMQLYPADYLGDTQHLTTEQHGAYLLLLMTMWRLGGSLPNDPVKLARIARVSPRRWHLVAPEVMAFFDVEGDTVTQKRLVEEYQKALSISEKRSASGKRGGDAKALKNHDATVANAKQLPKHSQISDIRSGATHQTRAREPDGFPEFWEAYPHKVGKPEAQVAYRRARLGEKVRGKPPRPPTDHAAIMAGLRRYAETKPADRQWLNPATFLNGEHWADEPAFVDRNATGPPNGRGSFAPIIRDAENFLASLKPKQPPNERPDPTILTLAAVRR